MNLPTFLFFKEKSMFWFRLVVFVKNNERSVAVFTAEASIAEFAVYQILCDIQKKSSEMGDCVNICPLRGGYDTEEKMEADIEHIIRSAGKTPWFVP